MITSPSVKEIFPAFINAQKKFKPVAKSGENKAQKYKFATLEDYHNAVDKALQDNDLGVSYSTVDVHSLGDREVGKHKTVMYGCRTRITATLMHKSGEWMESDGFGDGFNSGDKSVFVAETGGRKYAIANLLGLVTSDDPEKYNPEEGSEGEVEPPEFATFEQIQRLRQFLECEHRPDQRKGLLAAIKGPTTAEDAQKALDWCLSQDYSQPQEPPDDSAGC